ncbi:MAG: LysR family transcriptional regulator, partial [Planctomycetes bacterium]|nr:LysR family transcriptional regulator [Planctomycetota bacterium]
LTDCWQGRVSQVLDELRRWQALHPSPPDEKLSDNDGRAIVSAAITYLSNNASRMNYPKYRQTGLPVTSAMVESLVKGFNYRVKGTEKAWNRGNHERGCEPILEVRNAVLCDDRDRLSDFILSRPGCAFYRPSTAKHASASKATAA